jgi:TolB protein
MKRILCFLFLINAFQAFPQRKSFDYAYDSDEGIYIYSIREKKQYFITKDGSDPCISPDGEKLAYTLTVDGGFRFIQIIDLNTKVKTKLNTHSNQNYASVWSPDGKFIANDALLGDFWSISVIDLSTNKFTALGSKTEHNFSPAWLTNSENVVVQHMKKVLVYDLTGKIIAIYNTTDMIGGLSELNEGVGTSSSDRFLFNNDNKKIIFSTDLVDPTVKSDDGLTPAIFIYDILSKKTKRLSPKGYSAFEPIINGTHVLFSASKGNSEKIGVYSMDIDGRNFKLLFPNCRNISAKN